MPDYTQADLDEAAKYAAEQRLQWRMDLIVRHARDNLLSLEDAAEEFKKAEAVLTKTGE